jgi:hypothetical protein
MACAGCSLPEALCVCSSAGTSLQLPDEDIPTPQENAEREAKRFKESIDLEHFRRFAGLSESERKGDFVSLAQQLTGQSDKALKAIQRDQKGDALKNLMLIAVTIKKMALAYAMEPVADAAENLADALDKASRSS